MTKARTNKDIVKAARDAELRSMNQACNEAAKMMSESGITMDRLAELGQAADDALSPVERATVTACRRATKIAAAFATRGEDERPARLH